MSKVEIMPVEGLPVAWVGNRSAKPGEMAERIAELEAALQQARSIAWDGDSLSEIRQRIDALTKTNS